jgi:hypothetical protein
VCARRDEVVLPVRGREHRVDAVLLGVPTIVPSGRTPSIALRAAWKPPLVGVKTTKCRPGLFCVAFH